MLFNFSIQTKHFITKKSKFFKKMNYFIKILYPNTLIGNLKYFTSFYIYLKYFTSFYIYSLHFKMIIFILFYLTLI